MYLYTQKISNWFASLMYFYKKKKYIYILNVWSETNSNAGSVQGMSYFIEERMRQASYEMVNEMVMKCTGYNFIIVLFIW